MTREPFKNTLPVRPSGRLYSGVYHASAGNPLLEGIKTHQQALLSYVDHAPLRSALIFFAVYVAVSALSIPGAAILTLLGGTLFSLWEGTVLVSFASTLGATLAMLASRYLCATGCNGGLPGR